jgi:hypothetical protein
MPTFLLPSPISNEAIRGLERACLASGSDAMPWPSQAHLQGNRLQVHTTNEDSGSGYLLTPYPIPQHGHLMCASSTVMERSAPYPLLQELARGKINQIRSQAYDWQTVQRLPLDPAFLDQIQQLVLRFGRLVTSGAPGGDDRVAEPLLIDAYTTANQLVRLYVQHQVSSRPEANPRFETAFGCRLGFNLPDSELADHLSAAFNTLTIPINWHQIEAQETVYNWRQTDAMVNWAIGNGFEVAAGPLVDFSAAALPTWLWHWDNDISSMATFMSRFVETTVRRYANRIRRWQLTAGSNSASVLGLSENDLLGLTGRLVETVRRTDPTLELSIGIAQPFGDYLALADRNHSPYRFADTLIRYGVHLSAIDLELVMGVLPRGNWCRDLLDVSRLLDIYALLGVSLRVTLGLPSSSTFDPDADPELSVTGGCPAASYTPETQADWAREFATLAIAKPRVQAVQWSQFFDGETHQFPHCGLVDGDGVMKPVFAALQQLREQYLR